MTFFILTQTNKGQILKSEIINLWITLKTFNINNLIFHDVANALFPSEELIQSKAMKRLNHNIHPLKIPLMERYDFLYYVC